MPQQELFTLAFIFILAHTALFSFGFVDGIKPYENLSEALNRLNSEINPTFSNEINAGNSIDPTTGASSQQPDFFALAGYTIDAVFSLFGFLLYLIVGVPDTMKAMYFPNAIAFIIGSIISLVQIWGVIEIALAVMASIKPT